LRDPILLDVWSDVAHLCRDRPHILTGFHVRVRLSRPGFCPLRTSFNLERSGNGFDPKEKSFKILSNSNSKYRTNGRGWGRFVEQMLEL
jgi:hypothetical protein